MGNKGDLRVFLGLFEKSTQIMQIIVSSQLFDLQKLRLLVCDYWQGVN